MSIDTDSLYGSDEPPLRRLSQAQARNILSGQQPSLTSIVTPTDTQAASQVSYINPGNSFDSNVSTATLTPTPQVPSKSPNSIQKTAVLSTPRTQFVDDVVDSLGSQVQRVLSDHISPIRLAGHLAVVLIAGAILLVSQLDVPNWNLTLPRTFPTVGIDNATMSTTNAVSQVGQALGVQNVRSQTTSDSSLQRAIVPFTIIPEAPQEGIKSYSVVAGDTVLGIASKFGLKPESIQWANPSLELNPDLLRIGDQLEIPPVDGALHTVQVGDTLSSIAAKYKVSIGDIVDFPTNGLVDANSALTVGTRLIIPGGVKPYVVPQVFAYNGSVPSSAIKGSGSFVWPTSGSVTQRFWSGHKAIDIGSWTGAPVKVSDSGHVIVAQPGWNNGYGNFVVVDHGNGFVSLYAHMNSIYVRPGENVARGQQIGTVGNTGNSTGPHLHMEIRYQEVPRNPFSYLR